jgi:hypothetical protein
MDRIWKILQPRCRDDVLRSRRLGEDERAGARPLSAPERPPVPLPRHTTLISRDLKFHSREGETHISAPKTQGGVIVYEFRIAHN